MTVGLRLFGAIAGGSFFAAVVFGIATGDLSGQDYLSIVDIEAWKGVFSLGWRGSVGEHTGYLIFIMGGVAAGGLAAMMSILRDADAKPAPDTGEIPLVAAVSPSFWPAAAAFGLAVVAVGLVAGSAIMVIGIIIASVSTLEWAVSSWAERATGDPAQRKEFRNKILAPVEIPVLGIAGIAVLALGSSRIFLTVSKEWAVWVGALISAVIFLVAIVLAAAPKVKKQVMTGLLVAGALAIMAGGIASAAVGSRDIEHKDKGEGAAEVHP